MTPNDMALDLYERACDHVADRRRGRIGHETLRRLLREVFAEAAARGPEVETALTALFDDDPYDPRVIVG